MKTGKFSDFVGWTEATRCVRRPPAEILLQIHDELLLEVDEDRIEPVVDAVVDAMVTAVPLTVRLQVKWGVGRSWGSIQIACSNT